MPNPDFVKGRTKQGGRKKGTPNKANKNIKENYEAVFEKLGGIEGFYKWANKIRNQGSFYQMYSKMLPSNVDVEHSGKVDSKLTIEVVDTK